MVKPVHNRVFKIPELAIKIALKIFCCPAEGDLVLEKGRRLNPFCKIESKGG